MEYGVYGDRNTSEKCCRNLGLGPKHDRFPLINASGLALWVRLGIMILNDG